MRLLSAQIGATLNTVPAGNPARSARRSALSSFTTTIAPFVIRREDAKTVRWSITQPSARWRCRANDRATEYRGVTRRRVKLLWRIGDG